MADIMSAIEADLQELANRITGLIDVYAEDQHSAGEIDSLRKALGLTERAIELVSGYQKDIS